MTNQKRTKKVNPADLTRRNNNARKKEIQELKQQVNYLKINMHDGFVILYEKLEKLRKAIQPKRSRK